MRCCVPNCKNDSRHISKSQGITFHVFPNEPTLRSAWLKALGKEAWEPKERSAVCSEHFLCEDLYETKSGLRKVRVGAVPLILQCKNRSVHRNVSNAGISYHRFPNDPAIQAKWIGATGRVNWIPAKSSTICSEHFDEKDLQTSKKGYKYLSDTAVPVRKILIYQCKSENSPNYTEATKRVFETIQLPSFEPDVPIKKVRETPEADSKLEENKKHETIVSESPLHTKSKNLVSMLRWTQNKIKKQILKIKRIQAQNRRLRKKYKDMEAQVLGLDVVDGQRTLHSVTVEDSSFKMESKESTNCDYGEPASLKVCRICLAMDSKLLPIRIYKQAYELLTGISLKEEDRLPQKLCVECGQKLLNCSKFRNKSLRANSLMIEILKKQENLTIQNIKTINRENNQLSSSLSTKHLTPDQYDLYEYYTETIDALPITPEEKTLQTELQINIKQENEIYISEDIDDKLQDNLIIDEDAFNKDFITSDHYSSDDSLPLKVKTKEIKKKREVKVKKAVKRVKKVKEPSEPKIDRRRKPFLNDDLNETLFTITDLSFDEQIAEIFKRQDSSNYKNAVFKCTDCFKGFLDEDAYNTHIARHTNQSGEHECEICKTHFKHPHALRKHITAHHTQRFSCKQCTYVTTHRQTARLHERWHNGTKYSCPHCHHEFLKFTTYMGHIRIKHPSDFVCEICGYSFVSAKGIELHKKLKHRLDNVQIPEDGPFCELCNVRFVSVEAHKRHLSVSARHNTGTDKDSRESNKPKKSKKKIDLKDLQDKSSQDMEGDSDDKKKMYPSQVRKAEGPIPCEQCGLQLEDSRAYHGHFRRMHPDKNRTNYPSMKSPCMCEVCGRMFQSYALLKDHTWVHTGERPFKCDSCGKCFRMKQRLVAHRRVHSNVRASYVCTLCGKHFSTHSNRQRHMFIHTGLKPFKCEMCGKGFKHASEKRAHITYVHLKKPWPKRARGKRRPDTRQGQLPTQQGQSGNEMDLSTPIWPQCDPKLGDINDMIVDKPVYYNLKI